MGGWGRQNPWPFQWGGGQSSFEELWMALRATLGTKGPGPIGGLEDAWREAEVAGILLASTAFERAALQALPLWATDHLSVYEQLLGLQATGTDEERRQAVALAWTSVFSSINPELVARLQEVDPNITLQILGDEAATWQHGMAFSDPASPIAGMDAADQYPNYSDHHILYVRWSGLSTGVPPADKLAIVEGMLNRDLPSWVDYVITTGGVFYLDGGIDGTSRLDLTAFGA